MSSAGTLSLAGQNLLEEKAGISLPDQFPAISSPHCIPKPTGLRENVLTRLDDLAKCVADAKAAHHKMLEGCSITRLDLDRAMLDYEVALSMSGGGGSRHMA